MNFSPANTVARPDARKLPDAAPGPGQRLGQYLLLLAFPGVVVTALGVALVAKPLLNSVLGSDDAGWDVAILAGIIVAPTDPITVLSIMGQSGVPDRLKLVVEGESLFNDGSSIALYSVLKAAVFGLASEVVAGGGAPHVSADFGGILLEFVRVAGLGAVIGLGMGVATSWLLRILDDHTLETAITVALAWGSFLIASRMDVSGVIAVVVAALIIGNYGKVFSMSAHTRTALTGFWDCTDYLVNSMLFLLVGMEIADPSVGGAARLVHPDVLAGAAVAIAAMLVTRAVIVLIVAWIERRRWQPWWKYVAWWAGLRGSVSLALVLGLPSGELRHYLVPVVFLVVLVSLLAQALTMRPLIRWLRPVEKATLFPM